MHFRQRRSLFFFFNAVAAAVMYAVISFPDDCKHQKWRVMYCKKGRMGGGWVTLIGGGDVCMCTLAQLASSPSPFFLLPLSFHPHPFTPLFILLFFLFIPPCVPLLFFSSLSNTHTQMLLNTHTHTLCSIPLACFYHRGLCPVIWSPLLDASSMMPLWINLRLHSSP